MSSKITNLTVGELCQLNLELSSEKGLMNEKLPMIFKYHLSKVAKIAADEQESVTKLREEAIKSLGTKDAEGNFSIEMTIDVQDKKKNVKKLPNPSYTSFSQDMQALFEQERKIEHEELFLDDLKNVESGMNFRVLFKLFDS